MAEEKVRLQEMARAGTGLGGLRPGTVALVVKEGIPAKSLHDILDRITNLHGCSACGLAGLDLHFRVEDGRLAEKFSGIEGLGNVTIVS